MTLTLDPSLIRWVSLKGNLHAKYEDRNLNSFEVTGECFQFKFVTDGETDGMTDRQQ